MQGILGAAPDSLLVLITSLAFLLYIVALAVPGIYSFISTDEAKAELEKYLPSVDDTATLFGLVLAAIALIPNSKEEISKYNAALMFLSGSGLFIFLYLVLSRFSSPTIVYIAMASSVSIWYCLSLSLFALLDVLLPEHNWYLFLLFPPIGLLLYAFISLFFFYAPNG